MLAYSYKFLMPKYSMRLTPGYNLYIKEARYFKLNHVKIHTLKSLIYFLF